MPQLSVGKMRGLQTTSNDDRIFTILALDHGISLAQSVRPESPASVTFEEMVEIKTIILRQLATFASAVLLDPVYGLTAAVSGGALPGRVGMLLSVEDGDYAAPKQPARLLKGWNVKKIKRAAATAVKCFFYYHPDDLKMAAKQEDFVSQLVQLCQEHQLPLFAEPLSYGTAAADRPRVVVETARRISRLGIDILKCEFPVDVNQETDEAVWADSCSRLSDACVTPWALLSAGVDYDMFARQVTVASQAGASGFLAGRAIWKEAVAELNSQSQQELLQEVAAPRLQRITDIANEYGRPWTEFYPIEQSRLSDSRHNNIIDQSVEEADN